MTESKTRLGRIASLYAQSYAASNFSPSTIGRNAIIVDRLSEIAENIKLKKITHKYLLAVMDELRVYPTSRRVTLGNVPYKKLKHDPKYQPISNETLTLSIWFLKKVMEWGYFNGHLDEDFSLFVAKHSPKKKRILVSESRGSLVLPSSSGEVITNKSRAATQWTNKELESVFNIHFFKPSLRNRLISRHGYRPLHYWLYPIAYYSGMRAREIAQLAVDDIITVDGVLGFTVNDRYWWQRVKNKESRRFVPIHPDLITMGLSDYLTWRNAYRSKDKTLFLTPLTKSMTEGTQGLHSGVSKLIRKEAGITEKKGTHGFRHLFIDTLRKSGAEEWHIAQVVGHDTINKDSAALTTTKYGFRALSAKELYSVVKKFNAPVNIVGSTRWDIFEKHLFLIK